ncbi:hypothetical protein [Weissella ceti]|nr:hypothetical protein [Weissella ceti]QVK11554.1 hypothetical protein KHQ31_04850 [Weissella ceti]
MLDKRKRKKNQRYQASEMNVPFTVFKSTNSADDGRKPRFMLYRFYKGLGLAYKPSNKDIAILGLKLEKSSLTLVIPQLNTAVITTDMVVKINDIRIGAVGYFEIDEVIHDVSNGRHTKLLVHKTKQPVGLYTEVDNGK